MGPPFAGTWPTWLRRRALTSVRAGGCRRPLAERRRVAPAPVGLRAGVVPHNVGFLDRAWRAYVEWARTAGIAAEFIRLHPLAENASFYGGQIDEDRQTVWINLQAEHLFAEYQTRVRTSIRKAEKSGMRFSWVNNDEILGRFASFYRDAMDAISASPFYFFDDGYFAQLAAWPAAKLGVCLLDDQWVSAGLFLYGGNTVEYHLAASTGLGKRFSASNLLLHEVGTSAKAEGYSRLYLGGGTDRQPDKPESELW